MTETLAANVKLPVATFVIPVPLACSLSFMFPMSDATIAMAHGTGYVRSPDIFKAGFVLMLISVGILVVAIFSLLRVAAG